MMQFKNPIIPGFHPDPSICRVGKDYYIVNSTFEFLPGVPIFHSTDLIRWTQIGHCLHRPEQMEFEKCQYNGGIFAPTIRCHEGVYYMITTNVTRKGAMAPGGSGNFIITATQPQGPWSNPHWVAQGGIDPSIFWDDDGKAYFTSTSQAQKPDGSFGNGIYQAEINPDTGELLTESRVISFGCGGRFAEGPHMYKKDGWYYLMLAEGGTEFGHMATISRSRSVWGPFEPCPHNPILTAAQENDPEIAGCGHADMVEAHDGSWWMVFLGYRPSENYYHHMGRETAMAPVEWIDGWPIVNGGKAPTIIMETDRLPLKDTTVSTSLADVYGNTQTRTLFDKNPLGFQWNFLRKYFDGYSLTLNSGFLTLFGNSATLNDKDTPAFIGRRLDNFEFRAETLMDYEPVGDEEAGLAIAHTPFAHYEFVLVCKNGEKRALIRKRVFDMVTEQYSDMLPEGPVKLQVIGDRYDFIFNIAAADSDTYAEVGRGMVKLIASEVAGGCIGSYIGMYASGNGMESAQPAKFAWFDYEWLPIKPKKPMFFED